DHMQGRTADLRNIQIAVLDEADRMLDMGFAPAIRRILDRTPSARQTMLFSATMPPEILDLAQNYLNNPVSVEVTVQGTPNADVEQELIVLHKDAKISMVEDLLHEHRGTTLVFTRTRHGARKLAKHVQDIGHTAAELHSDRTLAQRQSALRGFKNGQYRILVATDIAARGIDVKEIGLVLNYDVPEHAEDYVHRIGRTGRAGAKGRAITLVSPEQAHEVRDIERLLQKELPLAANSPLQMNRPAPRTPGEGGNRRGGPRRGGPRPGGSGGRFDGPRGGDRR
ncbi:DEAD/DEAH box helicase, partial [bacterium]